LNKLVALLALPLAMVIAVVMLSVMPSSPTQASPTVYTYVQHTDTGYNKTIKVRCHTFDNWVVLPTGRTSKLVCGANGWVEAIWNPDGGWLVARNINTGNETDYGHYKGPIGGGYYDVFTLDFP